MRIGMDIGSTTLKTVVLDEQGSILFRDYRRHYSAVTSVMREMLGQVKERFREDKCCLALSGSAGMGLAEDWGIPFVQEVYASRLAVAEKMPGTDVVIELGGEDAKILFLTTRTGDGQVLEDLEVRMNGSCAGGTGAFIDQMATLLGVTPEEMDTLAGQAEKIYTVASRCGVFAKSDVQPLLNQGAQKADIAASIYAAVANQTIAGLAQGRPIEGNVAYLGGPLTFASALRKRFDIALGLTGICPEDSLYFVAYGAAISPHQQEFDLNELIEQVEDYHSAIGYRSCPPLFQSEADYAAFCERHARHKAPVSRFDESYEGKLYIGIDAGSTTCKGVVLDEEDCILFSEYLPNGGNPVPLVLDFLRRTYERYPNAAIGAAAVTGYGEELLKNAFRIDFGLVETMAHLAAAQKFQPDVDFIIDIGGQDIKCFQIKDGVIDNIFLNEACSSGCGSFLQTFAAAWGYSVAEFAQKGLLAPQPVDLGSRCTVFMNSSVKQAQKDGVTLENISAGLSISVVKNAVYKVIRAASADDMGKHIVVQGGTFLNDAVLRAFEQEIGREVTRPPISGLMGACGAALYARRHAPETSTLLSKEALKDFHHTVQAVTCQGCTNHCQLTVNQFDGGRRFIGGNRCEKPVSGAAGKKEHYDLYAYKRELLECYVGVPGPRGKIGIPMGLNMWELYPFWHAFFTSLGFEVVPSAFGSDRALYLAGQHTITSDTVCYPAKLVHGHIERLLDKEVPLIFYPCMSYNLDDGRTDNHFNCPVVAYYPETLQANVPRLQNTAFFYPHLDLNNRRQFPKKFCAAAENVIPGLTVRAVKEAVQAALDALSEYHRKVEEKGEEYLKAAKAKEMPVVILVGRPYHADPEVNHGISELICDLGAAVVTEDAAGMGAVPELQVLNQWTYHARLYAAAQYVANLNDPKVNLVQLVSFGCGVDAITTDEVRRILEASGRIYTQIKIDEITNLGAVKIRLRSLFAALEE